MTGGDRRSVALGVIAEVTSRRVEELEPGHDLVADLGVDSPRALRLLVELEERLDVEIPDEVATSISTVGDVLERVASLDGP